MSLLRVALRLILGVNICLHHASRWTRMVWGSLPGAVHQFHAPQFFENDTTPILRRPDRPQSALTLAAILITEHSRSLMGWLRIQASWPKRLRPNR